MSLTIYLKRKKRVSYDEGKTYEEEEENVYWTNITHNLNEMAEKAGIYEAIWRPYRLIDGYNIPENNHLAEWEFEDQNEVLAKDIIPLLEKGLVDLKNIPDYFKTFNSPNGWGVYENFLPFVEEYLLACKEYPNSIIEISR